MMSCAGQTPTLSSFRTARSLSTEASSLHAPSSSVPTAAASAAALASSSASSVPVPCCICEVWGEGPLGPPLLLGASTARWTNGPHPPGARRGTGFLCGAQIAKEQPPEWATAGLHRSPTNPAGRRHTPILQDPQWEATTHPPSPPLLASGAQASVHGLPPPAPLALRVAQWRHDPLLEAAFVALRPVHACHGLR